MNLIKNYITMSDCKNFPDVQAVISDRSRLDSRCYLSGSLGTPQTHSMQSGLTTFSCKLAKYKILYLQLEPCPPLELSHPSIGDNPGTFHTPSLTSDLGANNPPLVCPLYPLQGQGRTGRSVTGKILELKLMQSGPEKKSADHKTTTLAHLCSNISKRCFHSRAHAMNPSIPRMCCLRLLIYRAQGCEDMFECLRLVKLM